MAVAVYPGSFDPLTVAHLAVAAATVLHLEVERVELALSRATLGKAHLDGQPLEERMDGLHARIADRPWLTVAVTEASLIADISEGYDVVVMGADKWAQVTDPRWYDGDPAARDAAVARLPRVAVASRHGLEVPAELRLPVPAHLSAVSASEVRRGRQDWAATAIRT